MTYREDRKGDIRLISIDRPPLHLLDREAIEALSDAFARHPKSAPLVLTAEGTAFSAGVDAKAFASYGPADRLELARAITEMTAHLLAIDGPLVAAVPGHAMGGGFVLMLCADYRLLAANEKAKYALSEAAAGVPFPAGPAEIIRHELPPSLLRQMTLTSAPASVETLLRHAVIDEEIAPDALLEAAFARAERLAAQPAFSAVKAQVRGALRQAVAKAMETGEPPAFGAA